MYKRLHANINELGSRFLKLKTPAELATLLEIDYKTLNYYTYRLKDSEKYIQFDIPKKNGESRSISAPCPNLKLILQKLNIVLMQVHKAKQCSYGFEIGRNIRQNALNHCNKRNVLNIDLKDFFGTITFPRIYGLLRKGPFSLPTKVAACVAKLCCYNDKLPQGAPTSPVITNMVCRSLDRELTALAKKYRCTYSRYADDMTFSTSRNRFPDAIAVHQGREFEALGDELKELIEKNGFTINQKKTRLQTSQMRQAVTGIKINTKANLDRQYYRELRAMLHNAKVLGLEEAARKHYGIKDSCTTINTRRYVSFMRGKLEFFRMVRGAGDDLFWKLAQKYNEAVNEEVFPTEKRKSRIEFLHERVFIIETDDEQGTAFALDGYGLVTCRHVIKGKKLFEEVKIVVRGFGNSDEQEYEAIVRYIDPSDDVDFAILKCDALSNRIAPLNPAPLDRNYEFGEVVEIAGFPNYNKGDSLYLASTKVVQYKNWLGMRLLALREGIYYGNSGGPVFDASGLVIGIATRGSVSKGEAELENGMISGFQPISVLQSCRSFIGLD